MLVTDCQQLHGNASAQLPRLIYRLKYMDACARVMSPHAPSKATIGWWRGVVDNAFRLKRSYSTPGPVSTAMGDCLPAG